MNYNSMISLKLIFTVSYLVFNINNRKTISVKEVHFILMIYKIIETLLRKQLRNSTIQLRDISHI